MRHPGDARTCDDQDLSRERLERHGCTLDIASGFSPTAVALGCHSRDPLEYSTWTGIDPQWPFRWIRRARILPDANPPSRHSGFMELI